MVVSLNSINRMQSFLQMAATSEKIRSDHGVRTIVLFLIDGVYQAVGESAHLVALCGHVGCIKMYDEWFASFSEKRSDILFPRLVKEGFKFCIKIN